MLLLDWWRRRTGSLACPCGPGKKRANRFRASPGQARLPVLPVGPAHGLSAQCTVMTVLAQSEAQGRRGPDALPAPMSAGPTRSSRTKHIGRFWPMDLGVFYPHPALLPQPGDPLSLGHMMLAVFILLAGITIAAILLRKAIPAVLVGWLWFLAACCRTSAWCRPATRPWRIASAISPAGFVPGSRVGRRRLVSLLRTRETRPKSPCSRRLSSPTVPWPGFRPAAGRTRPHFEQPWP